LGRCLGQASGMGSVNVIAGRPICNLVIS
jgi:hypothetical protein